MDRGTFPRATELMSARRWLCALPLFATLICCEARKEPEGRLPRVPPFALQVSASSASKPAQSALFSLTDFRPLLTLPELSSVARGLDAFGPAAAARELSAWIVKSPPAAGERFRYLFLLGRLHEQAAQFEAAEAAYAEVSQGSSSLTNYARVARARALLALGRVKEIEPLLALVPETEPVARLEWPVLAGAARARGDGARAILAYQRVIQALPAGSERAESELSLSTLLLESAGSGAADRTAQLQQALGVARQIQNEPNVARGTFATAQALEAKVLALLPEPLQSQRRARNASEMLERVRGFSEARRFAETQQAAEQTLSALSENERGGPSACEVQFLFGKALSSTRAYGRAGEAFDALLGQCADPDLRARAVHGG